MKKIWKILGDIKFTVIILLLLVCDLCAGYFSLLGNEKIFRPLGDFGLIQWINTFGKTYPVHTMWFFALFILLALLGINTFACTTDRIIILIKNRSHFNNPVSFALKFSVHIMHYSLIIILTGYLITYVLPSVSSNEILVLNQNKKIPNTKINVMLKSMDIKYYHGTRLKFLNNRAWDLNAKLLVTGRNVSRGELKTIGINKPFIFKNISFTLKDFGPKYKYGMEQQPYISLTIKKTLGIKFYFAGTLLFSCGLFMYLYQCFFHRGHDQMIREPV